MMAKHPTTLDEIKKQLIIAKLKGQYLFATKGYINHYVLITRIDDCGDVWIHDNKYNKREFINDTIKKYPGNFRLIMLEKKHPWPEPFQI